jgi:hypothetical protein
MDTQQIPNELEPSEKEIEQAESRRAVSTVIVHEAIRIEGEQELERSSSLYSGRAWPRGCRWASRSSRRG